MLRLAGGAARGSSRSAPDASSRARATRPTGATTCAAWLPRAPRASCIRGARSIPGARAPRRRRPDVVAAPNENTPHVRRRRGSSRPRRRRRTRGGATTAARGALSRARPDRANSRSRSAELGPRARGTRATARAPPGSLTADPGLFRAGRRVTRDLLVNENTCVDPSLALPPRRACAIWRTRWRSLRSPRNPWRPPNGSTARRPTRLHRAEPTARQKRQCQQTGARLDPRCHRQRPLPPPRSTPPTSRRPRARRATSRRCTPSALTIPAPPPPSPRSPLTTSETTEPPSGVAAAAPKPRVRGPAPPTSSSSGARAAAARSRSNTTSPLAPRGAAEGRGGATAEGRTRQGAPGEGQLRRRQRRRGRGALGAVAVDGGGGRAADGAADGGAKLHAKGSAVSPSGGKPRSNSLGEVWSCPNGCGYTTNRQNSMPGHRNHCPADPEKIRAAAAARRRRRAAGPVEAGRMEGGGDARSDDTGRPQRRGT